jgi:hypothetical protein
MSAPVLVDGAGTLTSRAAKADRRWLRIVIPVAAAVLIILATVAVHLIAQPSPTDPAFLNPTSTEDVGSATLAGQLAASGAPITVVHSGPEAVNRAADGGVTLFVPAPALVRPDALEDLSALPASVTVVLVHPSQLSVFLVGYPLQVKGRWSTRASHGCAQLPAGTRALTYRDHYQMIDSESVAPEDLLTRDCFEHSVVGWHAPGHAEVVLVGADDIFRNDRIGELDNARVATSLFPTGRPVLWLDLHKRERLPINHGGKPSKQPAPPRESLPLPSWVKASAAGLALAAALAAVAAARRLGPPVPEPLPVPVRGTETALGRGRLYRRARARGAALNALRDDAITRLRTALAVPADAPPGTLVAAVAAHTGFPPDQVGATLYGPEPDDDERLGAAVDALDQLVARVLPPVVPRQHPYPKEWS